MSCLSSLKHKTKKVFTTYFSPFLYYTLGMRYPKYLMLSPKHAIQIFSNISPQQESSCLCHNRITPDFDLHLIIPVYNASAYLVACLDSVFQQETSHSIFVSIVDDGSTDDSNKIIREYITKIDAEGSSFEVEFLEQENQGPSCARNRALDHIRGKYISFLDSDDMLLPGALETLLKTAIKENADIVEGNTQRGKSYGFPWGKVYKSELFRNVHFPPGYIFEDTINIFFLYPLCRKVIQALGIHYFYRENPQSILHTFQGTAKCIDSLWVSKLVLEEYFSCDHKPTHHMLVDYLQDVLSTASHLQTLHDESLLQALFVIQRDLTDKYFAVQIQNSYQSRGLPFHLKLLADSLIHNNYRLFRIIIRFL